MPPTVIDYRDPTKARGRRFRYDKPIFGKHAQDIRTHGYIKAPVTHITLAKGGKVIIWYWADNNTIPWRELLGVLQRDVDPIQGDPDGIIAHGTGFLVHRSREVGMWRGDRTRYSADIAAIAQALLDRGIASRSTPLWVGNTAGRRGEHIGTVGEVLKRGQTPSRIVLYHGTDTFRLRIIDKAGLKAMAFDERVWNHSSMDKQRPVHREDSVYLTASRPQAEYYARKAVNIDRKRYGPSKRREIRHAIEQAERMVQQYTAQLERFARMTPDRIAAEDAHNRKYDYRHPTIEDMQATYPAAIERARGVIERGQRMEASNYYGEIQPVILQVTLTAKDYDKLMADDDYLGQTPEADPIDWQASLSHFGQVAFRGTIPPNRIKVIATGRQDASRKSD